jgi:hypothetical protein
VALPSFTHVVVADAPAGSEFQFELVEFHTPEGTPPAPGTKLLESQYKFAARVARVADALAANAAQAARRKARRRIEVECDTPEPSRLKRSL